MPRLDLPDRLALLLCVCAVLAAAWVTHNIYDAVPHLEDELAYAWQARLIAEAGRLTIPSPPDPDSFLVPFVIDHNGMRSGKYPLGWPAALAVGERLGLRAWVNPLLAGLAIWLIYRLGRRVFSAPVGLLAAFLTLSSPFFWINSGSLLSHSLGLVLSAAFVLGWLEAFSAPLVFSATLHPRPWLPALAAGLCLGLLFLTRPLTAVAVALPFALHGLWLLLRGRWEVRRRVLALGLVALLLSGLYFVWQGLVTGDPLLNPYTLWWPYDKIGFGPGHGVTPSGHNLEKAWNTTQQGLVSAYWDVYGWLGYSWLLLPFGALAALQAKEHRGQALLLGSAAPLLVLAYMAYWVGANLFGPRYYYEGLHSISIFSAAGVAWLAGWGDGPIKGRSVPGASEIPFTSPLRRYRALATTALLSALVAINLFAYLPVRLASMHDLFGISKADQQPFLSAEAQKFTPALIIVHSERWMEYGALLDLQDPLLTTPFIFAWTGDPEEASAIASFYPERKVYHYYVDEPGAFYTAPKSP